MSFEFKRFGTTIAAASNVEELGERLEQLAELDPACVEYHLKEGHISSWLRSVGEPGLAKELESAKTASEAAALTRRHLSSKKASSRRAGADPTICRNVRFSD
ncbi:MAG: hypothetical protein JTT11_04825 [Candidatus Brockarchaeota archaeon]|nr:hypothetical protein [Candidatus Brockarchaeota archaeon]